MMAKLCHGKKLCHPSVCSICKELQRLGRDRKALSCYKGGIVGSLNLNTKHTE